MSVTLGLGEVYLLLAQRLGCGIEHTVDVHKLSHQVARVVLEDQGTVPLYKGLPLACRQYRHDDVAIVNDRKMKIYLCAAYLNNSGPR